MVFPGLSAAPLLMRGAYDASGLIVPAMASNSQSGFIASSPQSTIPGYDPYKAFDRLAGVLGDGWQVSGTSGQLRIICPSPVVVKKYRLQAPATFNPTILQRMPNNFQLYGSNDAVNWTVIDSRSGVVFVDAAPMNFLLSGNSTAYAAYELRIYANNGDASFLAVTEMGLFNKV